MPRAVLHGANLATWYHQFAAIKHIKTQHQTWYCESLCMRSLIHDTARHQDWKKEERRAIDWTQRTKLKNSWKRRSTNASGVSDYNGGLSVLCIQRIIKNLGNHWQEEIDLERKGTSFNNQGRGREDKLEKEKEKHVEGLLSEELICIAFRHRPASLLCLFSIFRVTSKAQWGSFQLLALIASAYSPKPLTKPRKALVTSLISLRGQSFGGQQSDYEE